MTSLPPLIQDLSFILITGAVITLLFRKLNQPVVLGYLVAGFIVGPHFPFFPGVVDIKDIHVWADIGVVFLLFGLGLEFSSKKLFQVGKAAIVTAAFEITLMLFLGFMAGRLLGWTRIDSIFLGGILSISSTTIIWRAVDELQLKGRRFVSLVFGVLIIEDIVAILLLVLLSTVAVTKSLSGAELVNTSLRLAFFLILWFVLGIYLLPLLINKIRPLLTDETTLVTSLGLCLTMVLIATRIGFSPALGAFVMGSLLAETREGKRIEKLVTPIRNLFAAIFFVSVGMLIDPHTLKMYPGTILLLSLTVIMGKFIGTLIGSLVSGQSLKRSVQAGLSLGQIGEFSFIIATLGLSLGVINPSTYPIAVAVSALTTLTTPFMIRWAEPLNEVLQRKLPARILKLIERYEMNIQNRSGESLIQLFWRAYGLRLTLNSVIVLAIGLGFRRVLLPEVLKLWPQASWTTVALMLGSLLLSAPFLWAVVFGRPSRGTTKSLAKMKQLQGLQFGIMVARFFLGFFLLSFIVSQFISVEILTVLIIAALFFTPLLFSRYAEPVYYAFEERFLKNFNDLERFESKLQSPLPSLAPWDSTLAEFTLSPDSPLVGLTLRDSSVREKLGTTIALIERGRRRLLAPGPEEILLPMDRLFLLGTDDQLAQAQLIIETPPLATPSDTAAEYGLGALSLNDNSPFTNKSIRTCGIRESVEGLIVGIERNGQRLLNPDPDLTLIPGDLVWIVGNQDLMRKLR